jgi:hypothetical protein
MTQSLRPDARASPVRPCSFPPSYRAIPRPCDALVPFPLRCLLPLGDTRSPCAIHLPCAATRAHPPSCMVVRGLLSRAAMHGSPLRATRTSPPLPSAPAPSSSRALHAPTHACAHSFPTVPHNASAAIMWTRVSHARGFDSTPAVRAICSLSCANFPLCQARPSLLPSHVALPLPLLHAQLMPELSNG